MSKIGVFIETADQNIKSSVPGIITAAATGGEVVGFVLDGLADTYKDRLGEYGVTELVNLTAGDIVFSERPEATGAGSKGPGGNRPSRGQQSYRQ